ncbi:sugar phosphate isomerase/epimerase [Cytophagaceae bacterium YF14B1]|uniref:Sugar phosphate isomerase/epimerase n=1 Tax=Xanthocytophaga flava TaxID=3048013 RepID=A0AAE3QWA7_9BACT|nr:sugar phosphate isomerase/epimerase [Xanthocytophaga flavus]MDJ1484655.1 sugar phosphate isomerase/epimerase [Xanthocytophaga flavus]
MTLQSISRRNFLKQAGLYTAVGAISPSLLAAPKPLYSFACSAITWNGNDKQAIQDISSLGLTGIQIRANSYKEYKDKVDELKALLTQHKLQLAMFSSGNVDIDPAVEKSQLEMHVNHARFVKALGGHAIQLTNSSRPKDRQPTTEQLKRYAQLLNEVGKRAADEGIQAVYHNHMHQLGETPQEVDIILQNTNPKYIKFLLDIAHYWQGGGDPAKAARDYKSILHTLHIKDVKRPNPNHTDDPKSYQFVELGQGNMDLPAFFSTLNDIKFKGWAVIELDSVPDPSKTALQCNKISKEYLQSKVGAQF